MQSTIRILTGLSVTTLLIACSGHKPTTPPGSATIAVKPKVVTRQKSDDFPPQKLPGQWTVADILHSYGPYATNKLKPYFTKANVPYPPRQVALIALKQEKKLELWAKENGEFRFIREYFIQAASGVAGPKLRQGDKQVPEGIYRIEGLNPNSHYHLSMKINYPNEFDRLHAWQEGRTDPGSDIFIHGRAASIGCLAMGDETIEELFVLAAHVGVENVKVVIAPRDPRAFPLTVGSNKLPAWVPELYSNISREIKAVSNPEKPAQAGL